jgi:hypothetical protein
VFHCKETLSSAHVGLDYLDFRVGQNILAEILLIDFDVLRFAVHWVLCKLLKVGFDEHVNLLAIIQKTARLVICVEYELSSGKSLLNMFQDRDVCDTCSRIALSVFEEPEIFLCLGVCLLVVTLCPFNEHRLEDLGVLDVSSEANDLESTQEESDLSVNTVVLIVNEN